MRERLIVGVAAAASWGHAVASAGGVTVTGAPSYAAALEAANAWAAGDVAGLAHAPLTLWSGLWLAVLGRTSAVAVASLLPFHALAAVGLWSGGKRVGGAMGGAWALLGGLGAAGVLAAGADGRAAFPLFACVAYAAGAGIERRWGRAAVAWVAAGLLRADGAVTIVDAAGPALLVGVIAALLLRGNAVTLALVAASAIVTVAAHVLGLDRVVAVPFLALTGAAAATTPRAAAGLGLIALAQVVGAHTDRTAWPGPPAALRRVAADTTEVDPILDWLTAHADRAAHADVPARVALALPATAPAPALFRVRALERGDALTFTPVDDATPLTTMTDLGVVVTRPGSPGVRDGWRAQLPTPTEVRSWDDGHVALLWDRGLPPETLLATPEEAEARNHPFRQGLYAYVAGREVGPLLTNASSAELLRTPTGFEALFVRNQALWRAQSRDGTSRFEAERPLLDAQGDELHAFDPAVVTLPDGTIRLYAAELVGTERGLDPAHHPTRIVSWAGPSLDALVREPGARLEGVGLVDPAVVRDGDTWRLYVTEERRRVAMATSPDGLAFGALTPVADGTVPAPTPFGLVVQRQVMGWSVLYRVTTDGTAGGSLEICATGASFAGHLFYTRAEEACPEPVVLASRRAAALDTLLAGGE